MHTWTRARLVGAQAGWALCSFAAFVLTLGALFVAFGANESNALVKSVLNVAEALDLGIFDRTDGIKQWTSENGLLKNTLFNWGLGALFWLVAGRLVDRFARPTVTPK